MDIKSVPFCKLGNKTQDIKFFRQYLPFDVKTVIEPFCGSFAVSRICYNPDKYKIILTDTDKQLISTIKNLKEYNTTKLKINSYFSDNKIINSTIAKTYINSLDISQEFKNMYLNDFIIKGMVKTRKTESDYTKLYYFIDNVNISIEDYKIQMEKYKDDENAFIFCDPPYFSSDNTQYQMESLSAWTVKDNTGMYVYMCEYIKVCKCKIMIVINENELMIYLFGKYKIGEYKKIYAVSKKIDKLMIIANF